MYCKLTCKVTIQTQGGKTLSFTAMNHCEVEKSIYQLGSTAKIRIPTSARLRKDGKIVTDSEQTASIFNRGDKLSIELGYGDKLENEFKGFIKRVNYTSPLEIECEGYEYLLRRPATVKILKTTTIKDLIKMAISGTVIKLSENIPDVNLTNYVLPVGKTWLDTIQDLKDK
ncbi:MAG: hypothetical protein WCL00_12255, partial [Bacteroidota bacterium]